MTESEFTRWFCEQLRQCNCVTHAIVASTMQTPGLPDRYVAGKGLPGCWLEFKAHDGRLREDQRQVLKAFHEREVDYLVVRHTPRRILYEDWTGKVLGATELPVKPVVGVKLREDMRLCLGRT